MKSSKVPCLLIVFIPFFTSTILYSQDKKDSSAVLSQTLHSVGDYPEGYYNTIEDFLDKKVTPFGTIQRRTLGENRIDEDSIINQVFFFKDTNGSNKVKKIFAISYRHNLYIQQRYIVKYAKRDDSNEAADNDNSYHRIINDGKFFYLEGPFANIWVKGLGAGLGGVSGAVIDASSRNLKAVIFDFEKKEFDFIKNCKDFILFLKEHNSKENIDCEKYSLNKVREEINKLIK